MVEAIVQEADGDWRRLRGNSRLETNDMLIEAEEIDYNVVTELVEARKRVHFKNFVGGEELYADRVDYNLKEMTGTFYEVKGSAPGKFDPRPGIMTTGNPFVFQGRYAERLKDRYFLYDGFLTNCTLPNPWWVLTSPKFDIIPNDRALAYKALFRLKNVPLLYAPVFYKSMAEQPRKSGFLTPNFGNSNRRGLMFGVGYYWAINRSYDLLYRPQYFTQRGLSHMADFRARPSQRSEFNFFGYGINDKGLLMEDGTRQDQGGYLISVTGRADLDKGFYARINYNYLSSFLFRQSFTESFNEAVFSQVNSIGHLSKDWSSYHFNVVFQEQENFQSTNAGDTISIRRLPQVEFHSRPKLLNKETGPPVYVSWGTSASLMRRTQPLYQTRQFVERFDAEPRIMTALHWKGFHLIPSTSLRDTFYGSTIRNGAVSDNATNRLSQEFATELILPTLTRIFEAPKWLGDKVKHSIEPRAYFRAVRGIQNYREIIRFDETEVLSNTTELEISLANRLWVKRRDGLVQDMLILEVAQKRYFDPNFGGAIVPGQRTVLTTGLQMSAYSFFDRPRNYSPVVSTLRYTPRPAFGVEVRNDYDPLRGKFVNNSFSADIRLAQYFFSAGHNMVTCLPLLGVVERLSVDPTTLCSTPPQPPGTVLSPVSNQFRGLVGLGQESRRGWNAAFLAIYDYTVRTTQYANAQVTYNTDCCAYSFQYRRFAFGTRNENQYRFAFAVANIGSFGTLRRQDRIF